MGASKPKKWNEFSDIRKIVMTCRTERIFAKFILRQTPILAARSRKNRSEDASCPGGRRSGFARSRRADEGKRWHSGEWCCPSPLFLKVLILMGDKIICFHTLLKVLILRGYGSVSGRNIVGSD